MHDYLDAGERLGFTGSGDSHYRNPGFNGAVTGLWCTGVDRASVLEALRARRCYATAGQRIVLEFTDHLSDRELYCVIYRDILPSREKKIDLGTNYLHWDCSHTDGDPEVWLRYYATSEEREAWTESYRQPLPPKCKPPCPRQLPQDPT